jgi:hypothetical protein
MGRVASVVFGLTLALAVLKLAGCSGVLDPAPPHPHDNPEPLTGSEAADPPDASGDAP